MAEAITAVGLVASIIQITDFSRRFLRRLKEYDERATDLPLTFQAIVLQLPFIIGVLEVVEARAQRKELADEFLPAVQPVLDACRKEIEHLERIFSHVSLSPTSSSWNRKSQAMKSLRYDRDVQRSMATLKSHVDLLMWTQITTSVIAPRRMLESTDPHQNSSAGSTQDHFEQELGSALSPLRRQDFTSVWDKHLGTELCTCKRRPVIQKSTKWAFWFTDFSSQLLSMHSVGCPLFSEYRDLRRLSFNLSYTSLLLKTRAQIAISLQYGHGGMEISPSLDFRGVKRMDSPAFALFQDSECEWGLSPADAQIRVNQIAFRLRQLFKNGEASPMEVNEEGVTLLWVSRLCLLFA